jgi:hypothetical protein
MDGQNVYKGKWHERSVVIVSRGKEALPTPLHSPQQPAKEGRPIEGIEFKGGR